MKPTIIISQTGIGRGWGSAIWKHVSRLTRDEREAVRRGETVVITGCPPDGGNHGSDLRRVAYNQKFGYTHRVLDDEQIRECNRILGR